ncbi:MAG: hypothetical protein J0I21_20285 [Alphaproteobacteria bacterium]|nr:hypothetical protein [Alphaproteobacteria bacterium]
MNRFSVPPLHSMTRTLAAVAAGRQAPEAVITGVRALSPYSERILPDRGIIADLEQIPAAAPEIDPAVEMHPAPNPRAERTQRDLLEHRALQQRPRNQPHRLEHHPVAEIIIAPHRGADRAIAADHDTLHRHRKGDRHRHVNRRRGDRDQRGEQDERDEPEPPEHRRAPAARPDPRHPRPDQQLAGEPA